MTDRKLQEFWKWCGVPYSGYGNLNRQREKNLPPLDLNNLAKYAIPKLFDELCEASAPYKLDRLWEAMKRALLDKTDMATAVYQAIQGIRNE